MKRYLSLLLVLFLLSFTLTSCKGSSETVNPDDSMNQIIMEEYDNILMESINFKTMDHYGNYLLKWATKKGIRASFDEHKNVIMSKSPTVGYSNENALNLQTSINLDNLEENAMAVSILLYLMEHVPEHNFMRIIFTNNEDGSFSGASGLASRYLNAENQIMLDWASLNDPDLPSLSIVDGSAGMVVHEMSSPLNYVPAEFAKAYEIKMDGLIEGSSYPLRSNLPNPIKTLGNLLASCKSSGILFEIASFNGDSSTETTPGHASMSILVNENDVNKFQRVMEESQKKFLDSLESDPDDYSYSLVEIDRPLYVLDRKNADSIVSLLYTIENGPYMRNEGNDEIVAISTMEHIMTTPERFSLQIIGKSIVAEGEGQLYETLEIVAALSEVKHAVLSESPVWERMESNYFMESLIQTAEAKYDLETVVSRTFEETEGAIFNLNQNLNHQFTIKLSSENLISQTKLLVEALQMKKPEE